MNDRESIDSIKVETMNDVWKSTLIYVGTNGTRGAKIHVSRIYDMFTIYNKMRVSLRKSEN